MIIELFLVLSLLVLSIVDIVKGFINNTEIAIIVTISFITIFIEAVQHGVLFVLLIYNTSLICLFSFSLFFFIFFFFFKICALGGADSKISSFLFYVYPITELLKVGWFSANLYFYYLRRVTLFWLLSTSLYLVLHYFSKIIVAEKELKYANFPHIPYIPFLFFMYSLLISIN